MSVTKNYIKVGNGVEKFDGNLVEISVCLSDIPQEHRFQYEGKWYTRLKVNKNINNEVSEYGKTHYVTINEWKPEAQEDTKKQAVVKPTPVAKSTSSSSSSSDTLPF